MVHECPFCGSQNVTCRHCGWNWNPRDPENIPDICPRCRNDWRTPFKWKVNSKYGHGTIDPKLYHMFPKVDKQTHKIRLNKISA